MEPKDIYKIEKTNFVIIATDKRNDSQWYVPFMLLDLLQEPIKEEIRNWKRRYQKARMEIKRLHNLK